MSDRTTPDRDSQAPTTAPSSPPDLAPVDQSNAVINDDEFRKLKEEDRKAHTANQREELRRQKGLVARRKRAQQENAADREAKAKQLESLLAKSAAFSDILTKKTQVLGRVGSGLDGEVLGEHNLEMAEQPGIMTGGKMRDYQLEGLTWMYEICAQGMSGILADEMGLGKTIQTISLVALLREKYDYLGPHIIIAPLSTLSNWIQEFQKWTPSVPVILYHGDPREREKLRNDKLMKNMDRGKPTRKFPVVCTSYEIILRDKTSLSKINWELIIIDEGHRMKNSNSKLFRELLTFTSATRLLITGTPLQNNLKELWSLLHFLLPTVFTDWEAFESWFDFSDLQDEEGTEEFISDQKKHDLIKKIHLVLQPLLLRRIKDDVEHLLPKKREYVLYAPMTKQQTELYNIISDKNANARKFLENKVIERLTGGTKAPSPSQSSAQKLTQKPSLDAVKVEEAKNGMSDSETDITLMAKRGRKRKIDISIKEEPVMSSNAFDILMKKSQAPAGKQARASLKRKSNDSLSTSNKSAKSSRQSTPAGSARITRRGHKRMSYTEADTSEEDKLSDDEFESRLAHQLSIVDSDDEDSNDDLEERELTKTLELAKKEIATKRLGNPLMQLRLVCNSPHNFYNPWSADSNLPVDDTLITSSGKMLLLDRILPSLFSRGHKVLIFSQFKTQLDILEDYARDLRDWNVCRIDGSVQQDSRRQQIYDFNNDPNHKLFLLSTRAGGQGINLASADTVILFDSDWNPQQDLQAIDRAHRIGQTRPMIVYRLATKGTVEESLLMSADAKRRLEKLVIKKGGFKTMGQKTDAKELDEKNLRALLLKEGQVFEYTGKEEILSDNDLNVLCDRSDEAYARAEKGLGNAEAFTIVETKAEGLMSGMGKR